MIKIARKYYRFFAVLIGTALLLTSIPFAFDGFSAKDVKAMQNISSEDKRIASEISNITGAKTEEIFRLKKGGRSWNEVLDVLKKKYYIGTGQEKDKRNDLLMQSGLGEDYIKKLEQEGFKDGEITEAKLLLERVVFQLHEIVSDNQVTGAAPKPEASVDKKEKDETSAYGELAGKINNEAAIYYMLKLRKDFGSLKGVLDEYLYTLQAGLDLNEYLTNKKAYLKKKDENVSFLDKQKIITIAKIEEKAIEKIQHEDDDAIESSIKTDEMGNKAAGGSNKNPLPDVPNPGVKDLKPRNPADAVMDEIKVINPVAN